MSPAAKSLLLATEPIVLEDTVLVRRLFPTEVGAWGTATSPACRDGIDVLPPLCVRSCCFMLSFRVKVLPQVGQDTFFSPVCFLPCRAAWPDVVNVSLQLAVLACGQAYFFLTTVGSLLELVEPLAPLAPAMLLLSVLLAVVGVAGSVFVGDNT